jgi:hypothetical protein
MMLRGSVLMLNIFAAARREGLPLTADMMVAALGT